MRSARSRPDTTARASDERGTAAVDFVLAMVVLVPLVLGVIQVGLVLHVRNTLTNAASEGARHGAALERGPADAVNRTRARISGALADRFARDVHAEPTVVAGAPGLRVTVRADVPALGLWGPAVVLEVSGHAIAEDPP